MHNRIMPISRTGVRGLRRSTQKHAPALPQISDPNRERAKVEAEKRPADIIAPRALGHQNPEHDDPSGDREVLTPFAR